MTVLNIKDRVKNNKLNLSGLNLTEIPVKEIVSMRRTSYPRVCAVPYVTVDRRRVSGGIQPAGRWAVPDILALE